MSALHELLAEIPLLDHHAHGALRETPDRAGFEAMLTEARSAPPGGRVFDSQLGFAVRRWCAPVLGLGPHAPPEEYWARRQQLGEVEVNRRLLGGAGVATYLLDTGLAADLVLSPAQHARASGALCHEVVRLETVAERLLRQVGSGEEFRRRFPDELAHATAHAVATKSVVAYRHGLGIDPARPTDREVVRAADVVLARKDHGVRVADPTLLRHLLWCAVDRGLPVQVHCGFGDADLDLHRADPVLLTPWLRATAGRGVPVLLLHNYPYHRQAGYLAQVFDHVHVDVGLAVHHTGARSRQVLAEALELAPFHQLLYSSDGFGPSELHYLGAVLWRRGMEQVLGGWVDAGEWSPEDAARVARLVGHENARRVYGLD